MTSCRAYSINPRAVALTLISLAAGIADYFWKRRCSNPTNSVGSCTPLSLVAKADAAAIVHDVDEKATTE